MFYHDAVRLIAESCGACGGGTYACDASGDVVCVDAEEGVNVCGGCAPLEQDAGTLCGTCGKGLWQCANDVFVCEADGASGVTNACGCCSPLAAQPGDACGPCGLDQYVCTNSGELACSGATAGNACGGCGMDLPLGKPCDGNDADQCEDDVYVCGAQGEVACSSGADTCDARSCEVTNLTVHDQADLDAFARTGCDRVDTRLEIVGTNLTELRGLEGLRTVGTSVRIVGNPKLQSLAALSSLERVSHDIVIEDNATLASLAGFEKLSGAGTSLTVALRHNPKLSDLSGLRGLVKTTWIEITDNDGLKKITGLPALTATGQLIVRNNDLLESIDGFDALTSSLQGNAVLQSLDGLRFPNALGGGLTLIENPSLRDIDALSPLVVVLGNLTIVGTGVVDLSGLARLSNVARQLTIAQNAKLRSLRGLEELEVVESLVIGGGALQGNRALVSMAELTELVAIREQLVVSYNPRLPECQALRLASTLKQNSAVGPVTIELNDTNAACAAP